ncbi:ABC transporter permease [Kibdelosporangium aridum]|uniref:ABC transporter permease n=1 Tax=Kibdelosporangium aridum TaxID=2030 RepID=UPI0035EE5347
MISYYVTTMSISVRKEFQHRVTNYLTILAMVTEAVVYLVLWQAVATARGGVLHGWTAHDIAAYFIVWTLVRNMSTAFTPYGFEERIRSGSFSAALLRPMHPIHHDIAEFAGWKLVMTVLWVPVATVMWLIFRPVLHVTAMEVVVFTVAVWQAFLIRALFLWLLGMITFWTTRAGAVFDLLLAVELLLSGRVVPRPFLPEWAQAVAQVLPFQWVFGFPIETLVGDMGTGELLGGLGAQLMWIAICATLVALVWRLAVCRHSAVGN